MSDVRFMVPVNVDGHDNSADDVTECRANSANRLMACPPDGNHLRPSLIADCEQASADSTNRASGTFRDSTSVRCVGVHTKRTPLRAYRTHCQEQSPPSYCRKGILRSPEAAERKMSWRGGTGAP